MEVRSLVGGTVTSIWCDKVTLRLDPLLMLIGRDGIVQGCWSE